MKTYCIATTERFIKISMPNIVFWLFKKFAHIWSEPPQPISGMFFDVIVFDEYPESETNK